MEPDEERGGSGGALAWARAHQLQQEVDRAWARAEELDAQVRRLTTLVGERDVRIMHLEGLIVGLVDGSVTTDDLRAALEKGASACRG